MIKEGTTRQKNYNLPHDVIIKQMAAHGVTPSSKMKFLRSKQKNSIYCPKEDSYIYNWI